MSENYARENNCSSEKNCKKGANKASNVKTPMSKQSAAQRKTQDCDR